MEDDPGILKFIRGVDFSKYRSDDLILSKIQKLDNIRWIKLSCQNLDSVPDVSSLLSLEYMSLSNNLIDSINFKHNLENLCTLNLRRNRITDECIVTTHKVPLETTALDLSHNELKATPFYLCNMPLLLLLNISHNKIQSFEDVFDHLNRLIFLDVSHNRIECISLDNCKYLQNLNLSFNPLNHSVFSYVQKLTKLRCLNIAGLKVSTDCLSSLDRLSCLVELDVSYNCLVFIPASILKLKGLVRLNLSNNKIIDIPNEIDELENLTFLNISFNNIQFLPPSIGNLKQLQRLFANGNCISASGLPDSMRELINLEILMLAFNNLDTIPPSLCRCPILKRLILRNNCLLTLPDSIHNMKELKILDTKGNKDLIMPKKSNIIVDPYSIMDFSYDNVRNMVFALVKQRLPTQEVAKENLTKLKMIVHKNTHIHKLNDIKNAEAKKIKKRTSVAYVEDISSENYEESKLKITTNFKPHMLECKDVFSENIASIQGVSIFLIDNFSPILQDDNCGNFYDGDCYIILNNAIINSTSNYSIYYWIGKNSSIDKQACAAMHAINLRNFLGSNQSTNREEQDDETDDFKNLFPFGIVIECGMCVPSSLLNSNINKPFINILYRIWCGNQNNKVSISRVHLSSYSLDPRYSFMLSAKLKIYLWHGDKCKYTLKNKSRLYAEKFNNMDFKNQCQIINVNESSVHLIEFWDILGVSLDHIVENKLYDVIHLSTPIVYKLVVGSGYIELPQIELTNHNHNLTRDILKTDSVYIIDCWDEIFVWCGKKTVKMLKEAAKRLAYHLLKFFTRISYGNIQVLHEGYENFIFKSYFYGWEDTLKSQFDSKIKPVAKEKELWIKSSQSVKLLTCENFNLPKMEITSIFLPRQTPLSLDHCQSLLDAVDEYLEHMDCFVFENKKFIKLPEIEKGQFYSNECYVFLCKIVVPVKDFTISTTSSDASKDGQIKMELKYKVFFWEGRCCQRTGYLTFAFSLKKQFEECFGDKLIIERISQQQEPYEFLALFHPVLIIHRGYRPSAIGLKKQSDINFKPRLYQIRNMMGYITLRCVEIDLDSELLCSRLFYILTVPPSLSPSTDDSGHIYLWMGNIVDETEKNCAQLIVQALNLYKPYPVVSITEGNEPNEFWSVLGGKKSYDVNGIFIDCCRLFRCSNETGFFGIKEKYIDFCQDDLINSDVMLLDNGVEVFLWEGCSACDIEIILTRKLVSTYVQNCKLTPGWLQRKIIFIKGGEEPIEFRKVFQGFERQSISAQMLP